VASNQLARKREAAAMAPGDRGVAAEDLLARVVPLPEHIT
jgi:hypothetical protein